MLDWDVFSQMTEFWCAKNIDGSCRLQQYPTSAQWSTTHNCKPQQS